MELLQLLESRIKEAGLKKAFNPPDDGLCFYEAVGYQLGRPAEMVRDRVFELLKENRQDVSILWMFFNNSICTWML